MPRIVIVNDVTAETKHEFRGESLSIGRDEGNDFPIDDKKASRFHSKIEKTPEGYFVSDLGSTNGTKVNGKIVRLQRVFYGDTIAVGDSVFVFEALPGEEEWPPALRPSDWEEEETSEEPSSAYEYASAAAGDTLVGDPSAKSAPGRWPASAIFLVIVEAAIIILLLCALGLLLWKGVPLST